jgi:hypothetical protein
MANAKRTTVAGLARECLLGRWRICAAAPAKRPAAAREDCGVLT